MLIVENINNTLMSGDVRVVDFTTDDYALVNAGEGNANIIQNGKILTQGNRQSIFKLKLDGNSMKDFDIGGVKLINATLVQAVDLRGLNAKLHFEPENLNIIDSFEVGGYSFKRKDIILVARKDSNELKVRYLHNMFVNSQGIVRFTTLRNDNNGDLKINATDHSLQTLVGKITAIVPNN